MDKLIFTITDAGRQEIINASNTGTEKVEIKSVGIGDMYYITTPDQTEIGGEIKRITGIGGTVISPDTIHVSAKDDSKDEYVVHTVGLYTDKGTLFAVYSRKEPIINKSASTVMLISSDITFKSLDTANITFGDVVFINPPASESVVGVSRFATAEEVEEGLDPAIAVSAKRLKGELDKKANLDSPNLTGMPTAPTAAESDNSQKIATTAFIKQVLLAYAKLASPNFTGKPTAPTADHSSNDTQIATTAFVRAAIAALVDSSPGALDTLNELAAAIGNDPNFATTMINALAGKQPLDGTLTNLSGKDVPALIQYLGLEETINLAKNAVPATRRVNSKPLTGDITLSADDVNAFALGMTGDTLENNKSVGWNWKSGVYNVSTGVASSLILHFNMNIGSCPAVQFCVNYKNGGISYRSARDDFGFELDWTEFYTTTRKPSAGDVGALPVSGGVINGNLGIGTPNILGGSSIVLGDNDTGLKQNGDGLLDIYANGVQVFRFQNDTLESKKSINVTGRLTPTDYGNFDSRYVQDFRLGSYESGQAWMGPGFSDTPGYVLTAATNGNGDELIDGLGRRPMQKLIGNQWYNVTSV
ncbi:phage tail protein [Salmonella enterica]|uniref:phage tail protein n=1 Tax=Salmonella enterica TaxID=28901 RepID=UPI0020CAA562|nr:phage tail protein [Salmonella enterica]